MAKFKHNKKRNSAFLYEALVQELTKSIVSKNTEEKNKIVKIIKESFGKNSLMYQELKLYRSISETNNVDTLTAEKIINEAKRQHSQINSEKLIEEQVSLVRKIRKTLSQDMFSNFVPNYKSLASIYQIFNNTQKIKSKILLENDMANKMTSKVIEEKMEPIDNLVFKSFVKRFNEKYEENLLSEQKEMFSKYILSFSNNGVEFNSFLNEEIGRLKEKINESLKTEEVSEDDEMTQKTKEIYELLESYKTRKPDENMILEIAKIQELAREFSSNGS
jgi:hypothetical protein